MRWILYNALFAVAYCAMLPKFLLRMKKRGGYRAHFSERFGKYDPETARRLAEKPRVWVHAVSVGEANLAGVVIRELRRRDPSLSFVLSTTSSTGRAGSSIIAPVFQRKPKALSWSASARSETTLPPSSSGSPASLTRQG